MLVNPDYEHVSDLYHASEDLVPETKEQIEILLGFLDDEEWRVTMTCVEVLKRAPTFQSKILEMTKPLLLHNEPSIVEVVFELFLTHETHAGLDITCLVDALAVARNKSESEESWKLMVRDGLSILSKFSIGSESCMGFAKTFDYIFPESPDWKYDEYSICEMALGVVAKHAIADPAFALSKLNAAMNAKVSGRVILAGFSGMLVLGLDKLEVRNEVFEFLRKFVASGLSLDMEFDYVIVSALDSLIEVETQAVAILSFLIEPAAPWLDHSWEDSRPKGFNLMQISDVFNELLPSFERSFAGQNAECARRTALFLGFAPNDKTKIVKLLISRIENSAPELLVAILESLVVLNTPDPNILPALTLATTVGNADKNVERLVQRLNILFGHPHRDGSHVIAETHAIQAVMSLSEDMRVIDFMDDGSQTWILYQKILEHRTPEEWETNCDEFGAAVLEFGPDQLEMVEAPLAINFPKQTTGGDLERQWRLMWVIDKKATVLLVDPYSEDSWGNRHYLYTLDLSNSRWSRITSEHRYGTNLETTSLVGENPVNSICGGEIIIWPDKDKGVEWVEDGTPYFLESSEISADTATALEYARNQLPLSNRMMANCNSEGTLKFSSFDQRSMKLPPDLKNFDLFVRKATDTQIDSVFCTGAFWAPGGELLLAVATRTFPQNYNQARHHVLVLEIIEPGRSAKA